MSTTPKGYYVPVDDKVLALSDPALRLWVTLPKFEDRHQHINDEVEAEMIDYLGPAFPFAEAIAELCERGLAIHE